MFSMVFHLSTSCSIFVDCTSIYDIEIIYCPKKVTGRVFAEYPYNSTNE